MISSTVSVDVGEAASVAENRADEELWAELMVNAKLLGEEEEDVVAVGTCATGANAKDRATRQLESPKAKEALNFNPPAIF